jgi:hypothetical protein
VISDYCAKVSFAVCDRGQVQALPKCFGVSILLLEETTPLFVVDGETGQRDASDGGQQSAHV